MLKVLVVDDEERVLEGVRRAFAGISGYEVIPANNATEALKELNDNDIDVIVVDYLLGPPLQGDELIKIIRREERLKHKYANTPIIMMTGTRGETEIKFSMVQLGVEPHQKKEGWGSLLTKIFSLCQAKTDKKSKALVASVEDAVGDPIYIYDGIDWYNPNVVNIKEISKSDISKTNIELAIVVATHTELSQVLFRLLPLKGRKAICKLIEETDTYYLGKFGRFNTVVVKCEMGSVGPLSSEQTTRSVIEAWEPKAVVMVGIAFGRDIEKQKPGDVIVGKEIILYESERVGAEDVFRGQIPSAGITLINRFSNAVGWEFKRPDDTPVEIHSGTMLSGEKLVDDPIFKKGLFDKHKQAIAGEMEGAGVYASSFRKKIDWILVKGVADWGDGKKHNKYQKLAAAAAVHLALYVMSDKSALSGL
jgi:nucleoside phosphorylase/CheY-like chemotaxis protein